MLICVYVGEGEGEGYVLIHLGSGACVEGQGVVETCGMSWAGESYWHVWGGMSYWHVMG